MRILYLGYAINRYEAEQTIGASVAGNKMELGILEELYKLNDKKVDIMTVYPTASFPKAKKIFFSKRNIKILEKVHSTSLPFINLPIIKQLTQLLSVYIFLKKYFNNNQNIKVLTYNASPIWVLPLHWLKKRIDGEIICILADPPIDIQKRKGIFYLLGNIMQNTSVKLIPSFNKIIALNEMAIKIYAPKTPYIIVDGGFQKSDFNEVNCKKTTNPKNETINLVYSGALTEYSGIKNLIEAMKHIDNPTVRLDIYGSGPLKDFVTASSESNPHVFYKGQVSNSEILKIQQEAKFLINPRLIDDPVSLVTFPSKIIEYLLSGTPTVSTNLNGFTEDYLKYLNIIEDTEPKSMALILKGIIENQNYNTLLDKAEEAKMFILNNKSWNKQTQKIYNFIIKD